MIDDFEAVLPDDLKAASVRYENEWVIRREHVTEAINLARKNGIAVLGIEVFMTLPEGLQSMSEWSTYDFTRGDKWQEFVEANCDAAMSDFSEHCAREHPDARYGYILTTASERELGLLKNA